MKTRTKIQNSIIYSGPSLIDGKPIIVVAIIKSRNSKTGNMIQTHIIRADINPIEASKSGEDYSICGNCKHRGIATNNPKMKTAENRACYVNLGHGPSQVYKAYIKGNYPIVINPEDIARIGEGRMVRLGTYGDPAAVPKSIWDALLRDSIGHTAYTHQEPLNTPETYSRMMFSADTIEDAKQAHSKGYRTFRVIPVNQYTGKDSLLKNEILCPASKEAGNKVTCNHCRLCSGNNIKAKNIAIVAHGLGKKNYK